MASEGRQHALPIGSRIDRYEVIEQLGVGGFGITYKARDPKLHVDVAIKEFLPLELAGRDGATTTVVAHASRAKEYRYGLDRFLDEGRTLARFKHNNVVRVTNYLEANGTAYLVMDYERGQSLSDYLKANSGVVSEQQLKAWFVPVLRGLVEVHKAGFLHRDIKPGNIYLRDEGEPLLIDFGAARQAIGEHSRSVTGIVSAGYAPMEQYSSDVSKQGPWSDLYALGATLYRCVSGEEPVDAPARQSALVEGDPDPLVPIQDVGRGSYSAPFLELSDQMLVLPIKQRPRSALAVLEALKQGRELSSSTDDGPRSTVVTRVVTGDALPRGAPGAPQSAAKPASEIEQNLATPSKADSSKRAGAGALLAAVAVLLVGSGYWSYTQYSGSTAVAPPAPVTAVTPEPVDATDDNPAVAVPETDPTPARLTREDLLSGQSIATITSEPEGAEVALDGVVIGNTPFSHQALRSGDYTLTLSHPYNKTHAEGVTLSPNRVYSQAVTLVAATGDLTVLSEPSGAMIELDGERLKQATPATLEELKAGPHTIKIYKDRYAASKHEVTVAVDEVARDMHELEPIPHGRLTLDLTPKDAKVTLLDIEPRYSPGMELPVGTYRVQISAEGHDTITDNIVIEANNENPQRFELPTSNKLFSMELEKTLNSAKEQLRVIQILRVEGEKSADAAAWSMRYFESSPLKAQAKRSSRKRISGFGESLDELYEAFSSQRQRLQEAETRCMAKIQKIVYNLNEIDGGEIDADVRNVITGIAPAAEGVGLDCEELFQWTTNILAAMYVHFDFIYDMCNGDFTILPSKYKPLVEECKSGYVPAKKTLEATSNKYPFDYFSSG